MTTTLEQLVNVRSQLAEDLRGYYEALINALDRTPWYRAGQLMRASQVAIPARVLKEETAPPATPWGDDERRQEPARIRVDPEIAALYEEPTLLKRREEVAWQVERRRVRRAVVIGAPGGGKSFLTETTAVQLAHDALDQLREQRTSPDDLPLPVHVERADLAQPGLPADPADALMELLRQQYGLSTRLAAWLRTRLPTAQCWLILDALDQVPDKREHRDRLHDRLKALETRGWQCRVVLTCRTANYDRALIPWSTLTEYELAPFRPQEIRQFIEQWFGQENERGEALRRVLDGNFPLSHACRNPLIATLTCLAHEEGAVTEETRRGDLYARVLRGLARRAWKENPLHPDDPHIDDLLRLLEPTARTLFERRPESNQFTNSEVIEALTRASNLPLPRVLREQIAVGGLHPAALAHTPTLLRDELRDCGILVGAGLNQSGETQFSFLHRTFLEYLTASALARRANSEGWPAIAPLVDRKAWLPAWQEVVVLLAGKLADPTPLLDLLADEKKDDYFRHRLALAGLCLPEIPQSRTMHHHASLVNHITTVAFSLYWEHTMNNTDDAVP
ncbi:MAG: NACHT domain-containing protein, partial [Dehalococcoidia bacterium]